MRAIAHGMVASGVTLAGMGVAGTSVTGMGVALSHPCMSQQSADASHAPWHGRRRP